MAKVVAKVAKEEQLKVEEHLKVAKVAKEEQCRTGWMKAGEKPVLKVVITQMVRVGLRV